MPTGLFVGIGSRIYLSLARSPSSWPTYHGEAPALGSAMGWTYFYAGVMFVCVEYSAVATLMQYWNQSVNPAVWIAMATVICVALNVMVVKYYGEAEFIMGSTKFILLFGLVLLTIITVCGGNPRHDAYGFRYWKNENAIHSYYADGGHAVFRIHRFRPGYDCPWHGRDPEP
ncbi:hypothetical protein J3458_020542 [Metarhizium acridum]|uniref:uncharacterized protein n=1 Tax=Metarhizium acridum TaxID=92637 RepID=UPI001C6CFC9F|nr:hypothetical protein J3458_020542 [Metarhizium acridum]